MTLSKFTSGIMRFGFYLLFALVPLLVTPWNYELFEFNKMLATYAITVVIAAAWIIKMFSDRHIYIARTPLDIPIFLFVLSQFASSIFSIDPHVSWFGYYSRFNGGMWSIICYILLYYAFVSNFSPSLSSSHNQEIKNQKSKVKSEIQNSKLTIEQSNSRTIINLLKASLVTAMLISIYGVLERLGIDKRLWVQDVQNRVFSTLGQPNWLAAYLVALIPIAMAMLNSKWPMLNAKLPMLNVKNVKSSFFSIYHLALVILFFTVLLFTRSRSGLGGFVVADAVFWLIILFSSPDKKAHLNNLLIIHFFFALIIFFNGSYIPQVDKYFTLGGLRNIITKKTEQNPPSFLQTTGTLLEYGGTESGKIRKYVWQGALSAWRGSTKNTLIGTGTETFTFAFYRYRPPQHNLTSEWDFLYNKAHNEYLNYLTTTGIFGLGSYLIFIVVFIIWFLKVHGSWFMVQRKMDSTINYALFAGWLSILVTNFFGFSVVNTQIFLFLFPAIIIAGLSKEQTQVKGKTFSLARLPDIAIYVTNAAVFVTAVFALLSISFYWYADRLYATGYRLNRALQYPNALPYVSQAVAFRNNEPVYHDELSNILASMAVLTIEQSNDATKAGDLARRSLEESDKALSASPQNVNFWKSRTKIYYTLSTIDPAFNQAAIETLEKSWELSPNDPKIPYNLAILYGRTGNNSKAVELLLKSKDLKPNYRDAYWALYVFYNEMRKPEEAKAIVNEYLQKVDPGDKDFQERLKE